jgi:hypothetical protein
MRIVSILSLLVLVISCRKTCPEVPVPTSPKMMYSNYNDTAVRFQRFASLDLDSNGRKDIFFNTQLVGDPVLQQDKYQWMVNSSFHTNLAVNNQEHIRIMNKGEEIETANRNGYSWFNASSILLAQKIISVNQPPFWDGLWKDASHRYIAIQVKRGTSLFNGWIEISFDSSGERVIVHRAGISTERDQYRSRENY